MCRRPCAYVHAHVYTHIFANVNRLKQAYTDISTRIHTPAHANKLAHTQTQKNTHAHTFRIYRVAFGFRNSGCETSMRCCLLLSLFGCTMLLHLNHFVEFCPVNTCICRWSVLFLCICPCVCLFLHSCSCSSCVHAHIVRA